MRKLNIVCILMAAVLSLSLAVPALANVETENDLRYIENVNAHIYREIDKAIKLAEIALEQGNDEWLNKIILDLQEKAAMLTGIAIEWAARKGYEAVCVYVEVLIGGQTIQVDPIHILW